MLLVTRPALKGHICSQHRRCVNLVAAVPAGTWHRAVDLSPLADSWGGKERTNGNPKKSLKGGEGDKVSVRLLTLWYRIRPAAERKNRRGGTSVGSCYLGVLLHVLSVGGVSFSRRQYHIWYLYMMTKITYWNILNIIWNEAVGQTTVSYVSFTSSNMI